MPGADEEPGDDGRQPDAAEIAWRAGEKVEVPVQVVLEGGTDYVIGSGPVEGVLRTDTDAFVSVACGRATASDMAAAGRWSFEGPDDVRQTFESTLTTVWRP